MLLGCSAAVELSKHAYYRPQRQLCCYAAPESANQFFLEQTYSATGVCIYVVMQLHNLTNIYIMSHMRRHHMQLWALAASIRLNTWNI